MKKSFLWPSGLLLLFIAFIIGCKKDFYQPLNPQSDLSANQLSTADLKDAFAKRGYGSKLVQKISDTVTINWNLSWDNYSVSNLGDSLKYYFFELKPTTTNKKISYVAQLGTKRYLVAGVTAKKTFFRIATYYFSTKRNQKTINTDSLNRTLINRFSGRIRYENLDIGSTNMVYYTNGQKITDPHAKQKPAGKTVNSVNAGLQPLYTVEECYDQYVCQYATYNCDAGLMITATVGEGGCLPPTFRPINCIDFDQWWLTGTDINTICKDVDYPDPPSGGGPGGGGGSGGGSSSPSGVPCPGDPVQTVTIQPSNVNNIQGGRFGYTRTNHSKFHGGLDVAAAENTPVYAIYGGRVSRVVNQYAPGTYVNSRSFGNLVEIACTTSDGQQVTILYGHLNTTMNVRVGTPVGAGIQIGTSGRTGNAAKGYGPHVHVQMRVLSTNSLIDPEPYVRTKFTAAGVPIVTPC